MTSRELHDSPALNDVEQHADNRNYQQNVNKPAHRITGRQPQYPHNYQYHSYCPQHLILLPVSFCPLPASAPPASRQRSRVYLDDSTVIRFTTLFTPFTSLTSFSTRSFSAAFLALPPTVTTPFFDSTEVLRTLVERWFSSDNLTWAVMEASSIFSPIVRGVFFGALATVISFLTSLTPSTSLVYSVVRSFSA